MINAVRKLLKNDHVQSVDAGGHFERLWLNQQVGCAESSEETHPLLGPGVCRTIL